MSAWVIYALADGEIRSQVSGPSDAPPPQVQDGFAVLPIAGVLDDVRLWKVVDGEVVAYTPSEAALRLSRPSRAHRWSTSEMTWVLVLQLAEIKAAKRQELVAAWQAATRAGVTIGAKTAPTDPDSWVRYLALKAMAEEATGWVDVPIPLTDGTFELLTQAKAAALWSALKTMERTLLARLRDKVGMVQAAATVADVEAVTWST